MFANCYFATHVSNFVCSGGDMSMQVLPKCSQHDDTVAPFDATLLW